MNAYDERDELEELANASILEDEREVVIIVSVLPFEMFDTVIVFVGYDVNGLDVRIAVDHRPARELRRAILLGSTPEVEVEDWQVISRSRPEGYPESLAEREADRAAGRE